MKDTVVTLGVSRTNNNVVNLQINDAHSGDRLTEVKISLENYALLLTGLHGVQAVALVNENCNIAKKRTTECVLMSKVDSYDKEVVKEAVHEHFEENYKDSGWILQDDGTRSQQPLLESHQYSIKRYEDVENPLECERGY